ncbi:MAG: hypothetical protein ACFCBW_09975, partial [Candidatus Competibacterales bacterium]
IADAGIMTMCVIAMVARDFHAKPPVILYPPIMPMYGIPMDPPDNGGGGAEPLDPVVMMMYGLPPSL